MTKVGTLKELGVRPGDVVEYCRNGYWYPQYVGMKMDVTKDGCVSFTNEDGRSDGFDPYCHQKFRLISRADQHKLWRDMTPEEKGALLLAHHEGKVIEYWKRGTGGWEKLKSGFYDNEAYRVKPEPKIETIERFWYGHRITFNLINGKPDCASVKMDEL